MIEFDKYYYVVTTIIMCSTVQQNKMRLTLMLENQDSVISTYNELPIACMYTYNH